MKRSEILLIPLITISILMSCSSDDNKGNPTELCEGDGQICWKWDCSSSTCVLDFPDEISPKVIPECEVGEIVWVGWAYERLFSIYIICSKPDDSTWEIFDPRARLVTCEKNNQCPQMQNGKFECISGYCQNTNIVSFPRSQITKHDAELLCLESFDRSETVSWNYFDLQNSISLDEACPAVDSGDYNPVCTGTLPEFCKTFE